ncbi:MAG TPA: hypothetical protein VFD16_03090 [Candidatus Saccharimonadales bacterium]|nr:hypothetical protein [Candidatus Saccharimonadales bacterium]
MEVFFKFLFGLAIFIFGLVSAGIFLIVIKVILLFQPQVQLMGLLIS